MEINVSMEEQELPFVYGITVSNKGFTNREEDTKRLYNNLVQGVNTMLISPRRWGKSSLVEKVLNDIEKKKPALKIVSMDLFAVSSEQEFLEYFARSVIKASSSLWQDWMNSGKEFFRNIVPKLSVGIDPTTDFSLAFEWGEAEKYKDEILNLPQTIAEKKKVKFVICIDEFQNIRNIETNMGLERALRACWQRHKSVTYCLYGSKRHMMTDIFNNSSNPFYRFGDIFLLQKIKQEKWIPFIIKGFESTGKKISKEFAHFIALKMDNHSWYVQQFAHYIWKNTKLEVDKNLLLDALNQLVYTNAPLYQRDIESLSGTQVNLLKAIASGETKLSGQETMRRYNLGTSANVVKNKKVLVESDVLDDNGGELKFLDPVFELWFKKQFFRIPFSDI